MSESKLDSLLLHCSIKNMSLRIGAYCIADRAVLKTTGI